MVITTLNLNQRKKRTEAAVSKEKIVLNTEKSFELKHSFQA